MKCERKREQCRLNTRAIVDIIVVFHVQQQFGNRKLNMACSKQAYSHIYYTPVSHQNWTTRNIIFFLLFNRSAFSQNVRIVLSEFHTHLLTRTRISCQWNEFRSRSIVVCCFTNYGIRHYMHELFVCSSSLSK